MVGVARGHQRADTLKPNSQKTSQSNHTRNTALSNSIKPSHACRATQDRWVMVERSDRMWSTGEGNGKPLQYSCLENPMNSMKRQNYRILKKELPRSVGAQMLLEISGEITPERMKGWSQRIDAFELWCWRRLLRVPWTARRSNESILKEINPEISLEGMMLKLKLQYFGHLKRRVDSLEKTLMLGGIGSRRRRG